MDKYYCWACDFSNKSGEGNLARLFIKKSHLKNNYKVFTPNNLRILNYKYISPLIGILFCWFQYITGKKVVYLNYLPLWNFLLFILLPPKTIFGPITGGAYYAKKSYLRKFFFPFAYKISEFFLNRRTVKIYFSTELLKKNLSKITVKKSNFNFILKYYQKKIIHKKEIDFLIYYRKHENKETFFPYNFIKKLISLNFKIHIIGDYFNNALVKNHGYLNNIDVNKLLSKTFFSVSSGENIYSLFTMECINHNVKILVNITEKSKITFFKKNFIILNFEKLVSFNNLKIVKKKLLTF
jgi:hypothetical protein